MRDKLNLHPESSRLCEALKSAIDDRGRRYDDVAGELGMTKSNLSSILNGRQYLRADHIFRILDIIGTTPAEFFGARYKLHRGPERGDDRLVAGTPVSELEATVRRLLSEELDERAARSVLSGGEEG